MDKLDIEEGGRMNGDINLENDYFPNSKTTTTMKDEEISDGDEEKIEIIIITNENDSVEKFSGKINTSEAKVEEKKEVDEIIEFDAQEIHSPLASRFAPIIYLGEKDYPCSIEDYVRQCSLHLEDGKTIGLKGNVTPQSLSNYDGKQYSNTYLMPNDQIEEDRDLKNIPVYSRTIDYGNYYIIKYYFLFFRTFIKGAFSAGLFDDNVYGDIKFIAVKINKSNLQIDSVFFPRPLSSQGEWCPVSKIKKINDRVALYCSYDTHIFYPTQGPHSRAFFTITDHTSDKTIWYPNQVIEINESTPWNTYAGKLGQYSESSSCVRTPLRTNQWVDEPEVYSVFRSFCCCCPVY